jgi:hypothetical protein
MKAIILTFLVLLSSLTLLANALPTFNHVAQQEQHLEHVAAAPVLLKRGWAIRSVFGLHRNTKKLCTLLIQAAFSGNQTEVASLIKKGDKVNFVDLHGKTALSNGNI